MKADVIDQKGKNVKSITLDDSIFNVEVNDKIVSQYVYSYLSNQRQSNAHTKDRSEVSGGGKKPHKQKGTGRARSGSNRNPLWTGGGTIFGPTNARNWKKIMNKKFKKAALKNILSATISSKNLLIIDSININDKNALTKQGEEIVNTIAKDSKKVLFVTEGNKENVYNAFKNLSGVNVIPSTELSAYDILTGGVVVMEEPVIETIVNKFSK